MGLFEIIILLLFFLLPALSRLFEKMKQGSAQQNGSDVEYEEVPDQTELYRRPRQDAEDPDSLEEALRQIREALGGPVPPAPPRERTPPPPRAEPSRPAPHPEPVQHRPPPPVRPTPPRPSPPPVPPSRPRPRREAPVQTQRPRPVAPAVGRELDKFDLSIPLEVEVLDRGSIRYSWLYETLRDREGARKAIKLHEVLDPPPALKRIGFRRR